MRKSFVFGIAATVIAAVGCLAIWSADSRHYETMTVSDAAIVEENLRTLSGPRVLAFKAFNPDVLKTSYPPQYEGIPLLVGALAEIPTEAIHNGKLKLIRRVSVDFDGTESGNLIFQGYMEPASLPTWLRATLAAWKIEPPLIYFTLHEIGQVTLNPVIADVASSEWLITEQIGRAHV